MNQLFQDISDKEKIAIIVVGYNRLSSLKRLLGSLLRADYPDKDVPLIISLDNCGNSELFDFANQFEWPFGTKKVILHEKRLGLKEHILWCGDLTQFFKGIILLEDDLYVSPYFYSYTLSVLEKYQVDERVAGISLYKNETNGFIGLPFIPLNNGADVFAWQVVSSWGECWTFKMWNDFRTWLNNTKINWTNLDMPEIIKSWKNAWSKFFYAYLLESGKYFVFPYVSLTTNFNDTGTHGKENHAIVQVNLLYGKKNYILPDFDNLICYDVYCNPKNIATYLNLDEKELCIDLYGNRENIKNYRYLLSVKILPYKIIKSYSLSMKPIELNVINNIEGTGIYLYDTKTKISISRKNTNYELFKYYFSSFNRNFMYKYLFKSYLNTLISKLPTKK